MPNYVLLKQRFLYGRGEGGEGKGLEPIPILFLPKYQNNQNNCMLGCKHETFFNFSISFIAKLSPSQPAYPQLGAEIALISQLS